MADAESSWSNISYTHISWQCVHRQAICVNVLYEGSEQHVHLHEELKCICILPSKGTAIQSIQERQSYLVKPKLALRDG